MTTATDETAAPTGDAAPPTDARTEEQAIWDSFAAGDAPPADGSDENPSGQVSENENTSVESDESAGNAAPLVTGAPKQAAPAVDFEHRFKSAQGRLVDANRRITELQAALAAATRAAPRHDAGSAGATGDGGDPLDALTREYPELAEPIVNEIRQLRQTVADLQGFRQDFTHREVAAQAQQQAQTLAERFPDLAQIDPDRNGILLPAVQAEFVGWLNTQPAYVRDVVGRNAARIESVDDVADILQRFQASRAGQPAAPQQALTASPPPASQKRSRQLNDAAAPTGRAATRVQSGPPEDPEAAWAYFDKLDRERGRA